MRLTLAALALSLSVACATNPVTGKKELSLLSEAEELALGQQADAEIRREMGVYPDQELQRYVSDIGMRLAQQSHRPNLPWTFTVVDSPAINAFAVPGGYVYITRGILAYLNVDTLWADFEAESGIDMRPVGSATFEDDIKLRTAGRE